MLKYKVKIHIFYHCGIIFVTYLHNYMEEKGGLVK